MLKISAIGLDRTLFTVAETKAASTVVDALERYKFKCGKFVVKLYDDETLPDLQFGPDLDVGCPK